MHRVWLSLGLFVTVASALAQVPVSSAKHTSRACTCGHIPAGIRRLDAIDRGYDEITHIKWGMMQAMPDSVIPVANGFTPAEALAAATIVRAAGFSGRPK